MLEAECMKSITREKKSAQVERQREKDAWTEQTKKSIQRVKRGAQKETCEEGDGNPKPRNHTHKN